MKKILMAAMAVTVLASCSSDDNTRTPDVEQGEKTFARIELNLTRSNDTRATFDGAFVGLASEQAIDNVRLYFFNSVGLLEDFADFTTGLSTDVVEVTTGSKDIFALVNMAGNYPSVSLNSTHISGFLTETAATASLADIARANEFWMTNSAPYAAVLDDWDGTGTPPASNDISISVSRMVAKIGVEFAPTTELGGGKLDPATVEYKINNNPTRTRIFSDRDAAGFLMTPWYDVAYAAGNYWAEASADYKTTSVGTTTAGEYDATSVGYMIENSNEDPIQGNATYAVINGQWIPDVWLDDFGAVDVASTDGTFYRIRDKATGLYKAGFYNALPDDSIYDGASAGDTEEAVVYNQGIAYYALYINDTESNLAAEDRYVIERNTQWAVTITSVSGCGDSDESELPNIVDPTDPLDVDTYMRATIVVNQWVDRGQQGGI